MRVATGGRSLRLRFANPHGYSPLRFAHVTVARASDTPAGVLEPVHTVLVNGEGHIEVHPGCTVTSDPVPLALADLSTVVVSFFCIEPTEVSGHDWANRAAWATLPAIGDLTTEPSGSAFRPFGTSWLWVDEVDVTGADAAGAVVVLGDSITDGAGSPFGTDTRWTDVLAERFLALPSGDDRRRSVANAGIGGNTVGGCGTPLYGVNALARLDRDVLSLANVREVVVCLGTNDISAGTGYERVVRDLIYLATRIHAAGLRVFVATIAPRVGGYLWTAGCEEQRLLANGWIRNQAVFDAVLDFDQALNDPEVPGRIRPDLNTDGTHPNSVGFAAMAEGIDLDLFAPGVPGLVGGASSAP
ncbi:MAG: GDSL-type esterase/lipase family protein [Propionicimonas sp.]|nr:GDSL-type esterase/lipase family protein [Propionicimonas sp.]